MSPPSEVLTKAADLIRDTAAEATPGPWETIGDTGGVWREASPERAVRTSPGYLGSMDAAENAQWIALLSPAVAPALELILRGAAKSYDVESKIWKPEVMAKKLAERRYAGPMALARALLAEVNEDVR